MKRFQLICLSLFLVAASAFAQVTVKGTVTSAEDDMGLPGVSIVVKGTNHGTVTDIDGKYQIEAANGAVLQFSFVGYKTVEKKAASVVNVVMESDAIMMNEVVSLGYSSVKKAELSSAVVTISSEALTDVTTSDVGNMLQGKVAGVQVTNAGGQPGDAAQIRIRGTGSITASSAPVYVVDGVMGGSFNPNDVETISVLKDAGATGIYGAAAAGGVIVVTTKSGAKNQKVAVDVKATAGAKQALFGNFRTMDAEELYGFLQKLYSKAVFNSQYPKELKTTNYNWRDEIFSTGVIQNYNVAVRGGSERVGYYASLDYFGEDGTLIGTGMQKVSGHASMKAEIAKWIDMNVKVDFNKSQVSYPSTWTILEDAFKKLPWDSPYAFDAEGNMTDQYVRVNGTTRADGVKFWSHANGNSLHTSQYNYNKSDNFDFSGVLQLNLHFTDWLHFTTTNTFGSGYWKSIDYKDKRAYDSQYTDGYLSNTIGISKSFGTTNILKASGQWEAHSLNGMLGFEWGKWISQNTRAAGVGMPVGVDALNATSPYSVGGYEIPGSSWAAFAQVSYDYAKRYFLTATFRAEASSIFAPEKRTGYFPSVAASWLISNEAFMKDQKVVDLLKLRASYGITGNNNIPSYKYLATYSLSKLYQNQVSAEPSRLANPVLHWETANMAAVGVDLSLINRIDMSLDLYNTDNTGLLLNVPVAPSTGFYEVTQNVGSVRNQGIEYSINANVLKIGKWNWDLGFNIGFNKNRVTKLPNDNAPFLQTASSVSQQVKVGHDIYSWYMKEWAGVDPKNGDPLWYVVDEDGEYVLDANGSKTTTNDYNGTNAKIVGKATPIFSGGLNTQLSWNGIFLNVNTYFNYGNKIFNYTRTESDVDGAVIDYNQLSIDHNKFGWSRWEKEGDIATHPAVKLNGNKNAQQISSRYLEDGSYFRIKNVTLGYDFPRDMIKKAHMTKCRIYFTGDNLFTLSRFSGMDPEITLETSTYNLAGMYSVNYPVGRTFQGGVEISF